jgi:hypothetical protein
MKPLMPPSHISMKPLYMDSLLTIYRLIVYVQHPILFCLKSFILITLAYLTLCDKYLVDIWHALKIYFFQHVYLDLLQENDVTFIRQFPPLRFIIHHTNMKDQFFRIVIIENISQIIIQLKVDLLRNIYIYIIYIYIYFRGN